MATTQMEESEWAAASGVGVSVGSKENQSPNPAPHARPSLPDAFFSPSKPRTAKSPVKIGAEMSPQIQSPKQKTHRRSSALGSVKGKKKPTSDPHAPRVSPPSPAVPANPNRDMAAQNSARHDGGHARSRAAAAAEEAERLRAMVSRVLRQAEALESHPGAAAPPPFFATSVQEEKDRTLLSCAERGSPQQVIDLLKAGASASARHGNKLAATLLLERDSLWTTGRAAPATAALYTLLRAHFSFDPSARRLMQRPGERLAAVTTVIDRLAASASQWKCPRTGGSVLHCLLDTILAGALDPRTAQLLCARALAHTDGAGESWIDERDRAGRTARGMAEQLDGPYARVQGLFVTTLFGRFRLDTAAPTHSSRATCTYPATDLEATTPHGDGALPSPSAGPLTLKLCRDEAQWRRALTMYRKLQDGDRSSDSAGGNSGGASDDPSAGTNTSVGTAGGSAVGVPGGTAAIPLVAACCVATALQEPANPPPGVVIITGAQRDAAPTPSQRLMTQFPFALCVERADLCLAEAAQQFELSRSPLTELQCIAQQIAGCLATLHSHSLLHGDLKPRHIVRKGRRWALAELHVARTFAEARERLAQGLPSEGSTAFLPPEALVAGAGAATLSHPPSREPSPSPAPDDIPAASAAAAAATSPGGARVTATPHLAPAQYDIWAFAATLFELVTGRPLISSSLDAADERGVAQLVGWGGLTEADKRLIQQHGVADTVALLDLLTWLTDPDPMQRPTDMELVVGHAFLSPAGGVLREHAAVREIQRLLAQPGPREPRTVMISYCWDSTSFALRLCRDLAPRFARVVMDRLGDMQGFVGESMERMVAESDVVIAVVSKGYVISRNCLRELELAEQHRRPIVPINLEMPHPEWAGGGLGSAERYFIAPGTEDTMLYVDFRELRQYETKLRHELLPRLMGTDQSVASTPPAITTLEEALRRIAQLEGELRATRRAAQHIGSVVALPESEDLQQS